MPEPDRSQSGDAMEILIVGQSHVAAIRAAGDARRARDPAAPRTRVLHTLQQRFAPEIVGGGEGEGAGFAAPLAPVFAPALADEIAERIVRRRPLVVSAIGGNVHNALALVRHARPFDFHLSGEDGPPLDPAAEPVPEALIVAALEPALARDRLRLELLTAIAGPLVHLESPPPVADDAWIAAQADAWFVARGMAVRGVAPAALRYRMWRLTSRLMAATVASLGGRVQPAPAAALDEAGYLRLDFAADTTHGNARYGEAVIAALEAG